MDHLDEEYEYLADRSFRATPITQVDYNLNSPLMVRDDEHMRRYVKDRIAPPADFRGRLRHWENIRSDLTAKERDSLISHTEHHSRIPDILNFDWSNTTSHDLLTKWKDMCQAAEIPVSETATQLNLEHGAKTLSDRFIKLESCRHNHYVVAKNYLLGGVVLYMATLILNCLNPAKMAKNLAPYFAQLKIKSKRDSQIILVFSKTDREPILRIYPGAVYMQKWNMLLSRNFFLMIKDLLIARGNSLTSMISRDDKGPDLENLIPMIDLYKAGDRILKVKNSDPYQGIKLLEPYCNAKLAALGASMRPKIPAFTQLYDHIKETVGGFVKDLKERTTAFFAIVERQTDPKLVAAMFGSFRHWGHPYIDSLAGIRSLWERVTVRRKVDPKYPELLASDLAFKVLDREFKRQRRWCVDISKMQETHPLYQYVSEGLWPTKKVIIDFGDNWHRLPLTQAFDLPEAIDQSDLYADKAHSMNRSEFVKELKYGSGDFFRSKKVMETFLREGDMDLTKLLKKWNEMGLDGESLIIGLKEKERELKTKGRFYSLMSWEMRMYFVITEYLIKTYYLPLFSGLTMGDSLSSVIQQMTNSTRGHGLNDYSEIYLSNSLDYNKWNNLQSDEANKPVFIVMDKFLGMDNLISRTHSIFQESWVYYVGGKSLIRMDGATPTNRTKDIVFWNGQYGGFEGIRQKGWSVTGFLMLEREAMSANAETSVLLQGDNQIITRKYKLDAMTDRSLDREIANVIRDNDRMLNSVKEAACLMGLELNLDEVMTSSEYLNYGKAIRFRDKTIPLENKRLARVMSVTNDQIPSFSANLSSTSTAALTICQYSDSPVYSMLEYAFFGSLTFMLSMMYSVVLDKPILGYKRNMKSSDYRKFLWRFLYKDPSLGGVSGMNLLRFFIRGFPDPVTEALSWWKMMSRSKNSDLAELAQEAGNPLLGNVTVESFSKLLERPDSLNIPGALSAKTLIKEEVRTGLKNILPDIKNTFLKDALIYDSVHSTKTIEYLMSVSPLFPRFNSEFYQSTFLRITDSVIGLFDSSNTIQRIFSSSFERDIWSVIRKAEMASLKQLMSPATGSIPSMWGCSAARADKLRREGWGRDVVGTTVPHPCEMFERRELAHDNNAENPHLLVKKQCVSRVKCWERGPLFPYLGSRTRESTSIFQPWEKEIEAPTLKRTIGMRKAIGWFINPNSNLAKTIFNNIKSMVGVDVEESHPEFLRTGNPVHRFFSSRMSNQGSPGSALNRLAYCFTTTDYLGDINKINHDFMYQASILWSSIISMTQEGLERMSDADSFEVSCPSCLRTIDDITLDSHRALEFEDKSACMLKLLMHPIRIIYRHDVVPTKDGTWDKMTWKDQSYFVGKAQGFLWGLNRKYGEDEVPSSSLFPNVVFNSVSSPSYMRGILDGLIIGASLDSMTRRFTELITRMRHLHETSTRALISSLIRNPNFLQCLKVHSFSNYLIQSTGKYPKGYPYTQADCQNILDKWLSSELSRSSLICRSNNIWIFTDLNTLKVKITYLICEKVASIMAKSNMTHKDVDAIGQQRSLLMKYSHTLISDTLREDLWTAYPKVGYSRPFSLKSEVRHAITRTKPALRLRKTQECSKSSESCELPSTRTPLTLVRSVSRSKRTDFPEAPRLSNPIISGKRVIQLSTGAHYKLKSLLTGHEDYRSAIVAGDGSGGMTACLLRIYTKIRVIFNSLFDVKESLSGGLSPGVPGALTSLTSSQLSRCINSDTAWKYPSDLSKVETWNYFVDLLTFDGKLTKCDLVICDAEIFDKDMTERLLILSSSEIGRVLRKGG